MDWNNDLQAKVTSLKKEKKTWQADTASLQLAEKEVRVYFFSIFLSAICILIPCLIRPKLPHKVDFWLTRKIEYSF